MNNPSSGQSDGAFAQAEKPPVFVIKREVHPDNFMGFTEFGHPIWTSNALSALRVQKDELEHTMDLIRSTACSDSGKITAQVLGDGPT